MNTPSTATTLAQTIGLTHADTDRLLAPFGAVTALTSAIIGVRPHDLAYYSLYPPAMGFTTALVEPMLRPDLLLKPGARLRSIIPIVMFAASIGGGSLYCSAHSCSVARLHGTGPETLTRLERALSGAMDRNSARPVLDVEGWSEDAAWAAVWAGYGISTVPAGFTVSQRVNLDRHFEPAEVRAIVWAASMMGWLNTLNDALGVTLEEPILATAEHVLGVGWSAGHHAPTGHQPHLRDAGSLPPIRPDGLLLRLRLAPHVLRARRMTARYTTGIPRHTTDIQTFLTRRVGTTWPGLHLLPLVAQRAAAALLDQLLHRQPVLPLPAIYLTGIAYARTCNDDELEDAMTRMAVTLGPIPVANGRLLSEPDQTTRAVDALARAAAPNPADITPAVLRDVRGLEPRQIVAVLALLGLCTMTRRLHAYHRPVQQ